MNDLTEIFSKAIENKDRYNSLEVSKQLGKLDNVWCRIEDDSNRKWYLISETDGKSVKTYFGYLSCDYPVSLLFENCPKNVIDCLEDNKVLITEYDDRYSCRDDILGYFIDNIPIIDDRFLRDESIPFDTETFLLIDDGLKYVSPYDFSFESLKEE